VDDCRNSQSHFCVGIWLVLCRRSHVNGAGSHLCLADTQALPSGRIRKCGDVQSCCARSSGVIGRPFFSKYDGAATVSTRVFRSSRDDIVEGGCGPKRMDRSTPAVIRSPDFGVASQPVSELASREAASEVKGESPACAGLSSPDLRPSVVSSGGCGNSNHDF
jgi:hypothetical protein